MSVINTTVANCILTDIVYMSKELRIAFSIFMIGTFVVGLVGNLLTCVVIYCDKTMHTATNYYLFNLAVSDFVVAFGILLDLNIIRLDEYGNWTCKLHFFLVVALWNNGILTMTALAIERYIAIWHPLLVKKKPGWRRIMKIMCLIWIVASLEALPEIWTVYVVQTDELVTCFILPTTFARVLNALLGLVNYVIPLAIMTFVYTMIAFKVHVAQKSCSRDKIFNHRNNSTKVNKLVTLTLSFLACWLPFFTLRVLVLVSDCRKPWSSQHWSMLLKLCSLSWFTIVLNPLLFSLMSTKFRKALKVLWDTKIRRRKSSIRTPTAFVY